MKTKKKKKPLIKTLKNKSAFTTTDNYRIINIYLVYCKLLALKLRYRRLK